MCAYVLIYKTNLSLCVYIHMCTCSPQHGIESIGGTEKNLDDLAGSLIFLNGNIQRYDQIIW